MKRFILRPATLCGFALMAVCLAITLIPTLHLVFGTYVWDSAVLPAYEFLHLYAIWPLLMAGAVAAVGWYIASREFWWRYALNRLALALAERLTGIPRIEQAYAAQRCWLARWYPPLQAALFGKLPRVLQTTDFLQSRQAFSQGYLPPNRRYLALVRARIDAAVREWQDALLAQRWAGQLQLDAAGYSDLYDDLRASRAAWNEHQRVDLTEQIDVVEPAASAALIALEQLSLAFAQRRIDQASPTAATGLHEHLHQELLDAAGQHLDSFISKCATAQPLRIAFDAACAFDGSPAALLQVMTACHGAFAALDSSPIWPWTLALAQQIATLSAERLMSYGCYQEAIEVHYDAEACADRFAAPSSEDVPPKVRGLRPWLATRLFADVTPADPVWVTQLAAPADDRWRHALLLEAWHSLAISLEALFVSDSDSSTGQTHQQARNGQREDLAAEERRTTIRHGYLNLALQEARRAAAASGSMSSIVRRQSPGEQPDAS